MRGKQLLPRKTVSGKPHYFCCFPLVIMTSSGVLPRVFFLDPHFREAGLGKVENEDLVVIHRTLPKSLCFSCTLLLNKNLTLNRGCSVSLGQLRYMRFYCPISKIWIMERDHTKRGYSCRVSYLRVLCSRSFKVIKSMVLL